MTELVAPETKGGRRAAQGTITDHRDGVSTDCGPGVGWPEDRNTLHWLEDRVL